MDRHVEEELRQLLEQIQAELEENWQERQRLFAEWRELKSRLKE